MSHLLSKGYPVSLVKSVLAKFNSVTESLLLRNEIKPHEKIISPMVTQQCQALHSVKHTLREKWHLIKNYPRLKQKFSEEPPLLSYRRLRGTLAQESCWPVNTLKNKQTNKKNYIYIYIYIYILVCVSRVCTGSGGLEGVT